VLPHGKYRTVFLLFLIIALSTTAYGQDDGEEDVPEEDQYSGEGFSLQGASGFFNVLSPVLIRPGNILAGFSYRSEFGDEGSSAPPVSIGYGLAKLSEVYVAFEPRSLTAGNEENEILFGIKMLGFNLGSMMLGAGAVYRNVDVTAEGEYAGRYMHYGAQLLMGYHFGRGLRFLGNAGYSVVDQETSFSSDYVSFGAGLSYPVTTSWLLIADAAGKMFSGGDREFASTLGARYYAFEHIQVNVGVQLNEHNENMHVGVVAGIGFSSEILRTSVEGEEGGDYFPELPSLDALDQSEDSDQQQDGGSVPELPSLKELEKEAVETDEAGTDETVPEMPSLEELEAQEKGSPEADPPSEKDEESPPPKENEIGIPPLD
jgi:hypothetical protein